VKRNFRAEIQKERAGGAGLLLFEEMVPEIGVEPTCRLRRRIFFLLRLSPPPEEGVRSLEHAFTIASRP